MCRRSEVGRATTTSALTRHSVELADDVLHDDCADAAIAEGDLEQSWACYPRVISEPTTLVEDCRRVHAEPQAEGRLADQLAKARWCSRRGDE